MLKLIEVHRPPVPPEENPVMVASIDVTENIRDDQLRALQSLREIYPAPAHSYLMHDCGHDEGAGLPCTSEAII